MGLEGGHYDILYCMQLQGPAALHLCRSEKTGYVWGYPDSGTIKLCRNALSPSEFCALDTGLLPVLGSLRCFLWNILFFLMQTGIFFFLNLGNIVGERNHFLPSSISETNSVWKGLIELGKMLISYLRIILNPRHSECLP